MWRIFIAVSVRMCVESAALLSIRSRTWTDTWSSIVKILYRYAWEQCQFRTISRPLLQFALLSVWASSHVSRKRTITSRFQFSDRS